MNIASSAVENRRTARRPAARAAARRPPPAACRPARVSLTRRRSCVELCARSLAASHVFLLGSAGESGLAAAVAVSLARCLDLARCVG